MRAKQLTDLFEYGFPPCEQITLWVYFFSRISYHDTITASKDNSIQGLTFVNVSLMLDTSFRGRTTSGFLFEATRDSDVMTKKGLFVLKKS